ncbi:MAG: ATP-dependent nuclease [Chloroflexota bacterium]
MTVLVGENDSGKTALIDFLEIMLTNNPPQPQDYFRCIPSRDCADVQHGEEVAQEQIEGEMVLGQVSNAEETPADLLDDKGNLRIRRVYSADVNTTYVYRRKYLDDRLNGYETMKADDLRNLLADLGLPDEKNQDLRKEAVRKYIAKPDVPCRFDWVAVPFSVIKPFLPRLIRYNVDDYRNPSSMIFKTLQEVFENELYVVGADGRRELRSATLSQVLEDIKGKVADATQRFKEHVQKYNDKILDITIDPDIDLSSGLRQSPIRVKDETGLFHILDNRGFGTKKRMFMAIFEWGKEVATDIGQEYVLRCYDEPDNSLHIDAQRRLYKTIKSIVEETESKNQVILCTHSLFIVDAAPASSIKLVRRDDSGSTTIEYLDSFGDEAVRQFVQHMCREMGLSNSHIFFEKCFIVLEGQTEVNFLPLAYRKKYGSALSEDGITLVNLEGNGAAVNFLKLLMKNKKELTLVFLDADTTELRKNKVLAAHNKIVDGMDKAEYIRFVEDFFANKVLYVGSQEFEDTFSDEVITSCLNRERPKNDKSSWTVEEIREIRTKAKKFSRELVKAVKEQCPPHYIGKPELGTLLSETVEEGQIPDVVVELFEKARRIAGIH